MNNDIDSTRLNYKHFLPGIAWFFVVLILMCTPGKELPKMGSWFDYLDMDKVIHVSVFGLMAFLFMWPMGKSNERTRAKQNYFLKIAISTAIWGFTTELIQKYFIEGRSFDPVDFIADSVGGLIAYLVARRRFARKHVPAIPVN